MVKSSKKGEKSEQNKEKEEYVNLDFIRKIKNMFIKPSVFFNKIKDERFDISLKLFMAFYLAYILVSVIINLSQEQISIYQGIANLIFSSLVALVSVALLSYITFIIGKLFGSKKGFFNSFKPVTYTLILWVIYSFINLLFFYLVPFDNSMFQALQVSQDVSVIKEAYISFLKQPGAIINTIILIISLIHIIIFNSKGIEKFQEISKGKAYAVVIISWFIFLLIIVLLMLLMIMSSLS